MIRRRGFIVLVLVLLIVAAGYWLSRDLKSSPKINFHKIAVNIQQPYLSGGQLYFFTGSSFASLNLNTVRTTRLSNYFDTQGQITVDAWSNGSVIFSTSGTSNNDSFGSALAAAGDTISSPHWWQYNFGTQQLALINFSGADSCMGFGQTSNSLYCFMSYKGSSYQYSLIQYSLADGVQKEVLRTADPVSSVQQQGMNIYYVTTGLGGSQKLNIYNASTNSSKVLYTSKQRINYALGANEILISESSLLNNVPLSQRAGDVNPNQTIKQNLVLLSNSGNIIKHTAAASSGGGVGFIPGNTSGPLTFNIGSGAFYVTSGNTIKRSGSANEIAASYLWQYGGSTYYLDSGNNLYSSMLVEPLKSGSSFNDTQNTPPNEFYISSVSNGQNTTYLDNSGKDFADSALDVDSFLKSLGYDPNQFSFDWQIISDSGTAYANTTVLN